MTTTGRVLLVDDDEMVLRGYRRIIERAGHAVDVAVSGDEALALFGKKRYDVVISDISMPGMNGVELLRRIREVDLDVPVILATAAPSVSSAARAVELGALRYLLKPINPEELTAAVAQALRLYRVATLKREALELGDGAGTIGDRAGLEARFDRAVTVLWLALQPIVDLAQRRVVAHEALLRSDEPSLARPAAILDAATRLARLPALGRTVRDRCAALLADDRIPMLFVNLHTSDLLDDRLYDAAAPLSRVAPRVVLDITERAALDDVGDARARVARLRALGFRIAVDNLGAGYAGLTSFAQLEPEFVKLDISLVRDIDRQATKQKLVRSLCEVCVDLGIVVIAEGVESQGERDMLVELGCTHLQGFLFAHPERELHDLAL
jgi:EAL domain-containing protein (putative c-di-GMP-specific phosphodiesterase class I)